MLLVGFLLIGIAAAIVAALHVDGIGATFLFAAAPIAAWLWIALAASVVGGGLSGWCLARHTVAGAIPPARVVWLRAGLAACAMLIVLAVADAVAGHVSLTGIALGLAFGAGALAVGYQALDALKEQDIALHTHWGGLGGGLGGWRLSRPAALVLLTLLAAGAAVASLSMGAGAPAQPPPKEQAADKDAKPPKPAEKP